MKQKPRWANIICNRNFVPRMLIVTDGEWTSEIPVSNSKLEVVKRTARTIYDVPSKRILVTQVLDDISTNQDEN